MDGALVAWPARLSVIVLDNLKGTAGVQAQEPRILVTTISDQNLRWVR